jgi:hypothetical protein
LESNGAAEAGKNTDAGISVEVDEVRGAFSIKSDGAGVEMVVERVGPVVSMVRMGENGDAVCGLMCTVVGMVRLRVVVFWMRAAVVVGVVGEGLSGGLYR